MVASIITEIPIGTSNIIVDDDPDNNCVHISIGVSIETITYDYIKHNQQEFANKCEMLEEGRKIFRDDGRGLMPFDSILKAVGVHYDLGTDLSKEDLTDAYLHKKYKK